MIECEGAGLRHRLLRGGGNGDKRRNNEGRAEKVEAAHDLLLSIGTQPPAVRNTGWRNKPRHSLTPITLRRLPHEIVRSRQFQNNGGVCATLSGPRKTAPSTKRSGKARAFLPSSSASLPSALRPAATPTLAF